MMPEDIDAKLHEFSLNYYKRRGRMPRAGHIKKQALKLYRRHIALASLRSRRTLRQRAEWSL